MVSTMTFTGERMENHPNSLLSQVSTQRYIFASKLFTNKKILDFGCGTGYGSNILSRNNQVTAYDLHPVFQKKYLNRNISFSTKLNGTEKYDVIICFEVIEHLKNYNTFLTKFYKLLNKNGYLLISTPNNFTKEKITNPYHTKEFELKELYKILRSIFPRVKVFGQIKTTYHSSDKNILLPVHKKLVKKIFSSIYNFDLRNTRLLSKIEHLSFYKKIGDLQRSIPIDKTIYPINPLKNYLVPEISIFLCQK